MRLLAASGDTWGISGPTFVVIYIVVGLASVAVAGGSRALARNAKKRGRRRGPSALEEPTAIAYLAGGPRRAIAASLTRLRAADAIGASPYQRLAVTRPVPADSAPLDRAIHAAISRGADGYRQLAADRYVAAELAAIAQRLEAEGLLLPAKARRRVQLSAAWLLPVLALGVVRAVAGVQNDRPISNLVTLMVMIAIVGVVLLVPSHRSKHGDRMLTKARTRHAHLLPGLAPSTTAYGPPGAATQVALFGKSPLWGADRAFAAAASLPVAGMGAGLFSGFYLYGGGGGGGGSSTYTSSGSSCGGGGGGGGCGG